MSFEIKNDFFLVGLGGESKGRMREGKPVLSPSGKPTFKISAVPIKADGGSLPGYTVHSEVPVYTDLGKKYVTAGKVWITPYISNGFIAYSVVAEKVVECEA